MAITLLQPFNLDPTANYSVNQITATANVTGGNIVTVGNVTATGNVTGNYILGNGSQLTGLPATYSNSNVTTLMADFGSNTISTTGNVTAGNITTSGNVYAGAGNAGYVYGNAFFMTGISAAVSVTKIENGNSNVWVRTPGGDVTVTAGGVANVALFSTGSLTLSGAFATPKTITSNVVVAENVNGMFLGPLTFGDNAYLTVPSSSTVYIYAP